MKNKKILIMVAVILLIVIIGVIGFTFAKYQSIGKSNINPKVAKWHVLVNDVDISDGKTKKFNANIDWNQNDNIYNNGKTLIAPGSKGVVSFVIDASTSEVSVKYNIKLDTSKLKDHKQIKITKITSTQDGKETIINATEEFNGLINLEEINKPVTIKVYIEWDPDINDDDDYNLGTNDIPLSIGVEVTISQKVNNTLAETIINNAKNPKDKNSTIYSPNSKTIPPRQVSSGDEKTLSITEDTLGKSYYFRGNVIDNYLNFNKMCWRVVRIEGDGSIKLILEDKTQTCESATSGENTQIGQATYGYKIEKVDEKTYYQADYENCTADTDTCIKNQLEKWFKEKFKEENIVNKIKDDIWYLGSQKSYYTNDGEKSDKFSDNNKIHSSLEELVYARKLGNADLKFIYNDNVQSKIGILTVNEYAFAGLISGGGSSNSYIKNTIHTISDWYWTSSYGGMYIIIII